jgi:hypothetical protein
MNPIQSAEGAACAGGMRPVTCTSNSSSTKGRSDKPAGMRGALEMSGDFVRQAMRDRGFVDIQASNVQMIEAFAQYEPGLEYEIMEVGLDPAAAAEVATLMGTQTPGDMNQVLRIVAHVDPARVAALLK